jgi:Short C-terminal domain
VSRSSSAIIDDHLTVSVRNVISPSVAASTRARERLASYQLRSDVLEAAAAMVSDQRSDIYVVRLESALSDAEIVLRMMDGRHAGVMGLLVLTSERILFRSRRRSGPNFSAAGGGCCDRGLHPLGYRHCPRHHTRWQLDGRPDPRQAGEMLGDDAQATVLGEPLPGRGPLRLLAELRALRESGAISAAEFEMRKSAIGRDI